MDTRKISCVIHWTETCPVDGAFQLLKNWGLCHAALQFKDTLYSPQIFRDPIALHTCRLHVFSISRLHSWDYICSFPSGSKYSTYFILILDAMMEAGRNTLDEAEPKQVLLTTSPVFTGRRLQCPRQVTETSTPTIQKAN